MEHDAIAAFGSLSSQTPGLAHGLLGFSLGSGVAAAILSRTTPDHLVLCAAFPSLRQAAVCAGAPGWSARIFEGIWQSRERLRENVIPVTIVHGEKDRLFRPELAHELAAACSGAYELIIVPGMAHNDPIFRADSANWAAIAARIRSSRTGA